MSLSYHMSSPTLNLESIFEPAAPSLTRDTHALKLKLLDIHISSLDSNTVFVDD